MPAHFPVDPSASVFVVGSLVLACSARVMRCPEAGESLQATGFIMEAGGKGFNVALALHRLGIRVDGLFAVGDDPAGQFLRKAFVDMGLDAGMITTISSSTGAGVGLIQADGENRIAVYPGANAHLLAEHVDAIADRLRPAGLIFAQFEVGDAPIAAAFARGRRDGVATVLNPSPYRPIASDILGPTDILIVNEQEAAMLGKDMSVAGSHEALAGILRAAGVATFIVTRGSRGSLAWQDGELIEQPPFPVEVVDSIGAGDAFTAAVIAALMREADIGSALKWGCAAGALAVSALGVAQSLPDRAALEALVRS